MARVLALRHVPFEDLGLLESILGQRGHGIQYVEAPVVSLADEVDPLKPDLLVILGGPISCFEDTSYPFLAEETKHIRRRLEYGGATLGICLGAQLMARALGARVYPGEGKELGWAPVNLTEAGRHSCLHHLEDSRVLHWHGDTFELPKDSVRLASTETYANQAFQWGSAALALQFHAETIGAELEKWFVGHAREIAETPGVTVPSLRSETAYWSPFLQKRATKAFEEWLASLGL